MIFEGEIRDDEWGTEVFGRLSTCNDPVAEEAVYHTSCMNSFRLFVHSGNKRGRPADLSMIENFGKICNWLECDANCDLYALKEIFDKMVELSKD